jgi:hypothetical protein
MWIPIGNKKLLVTPLPDKVVAAANARIQKNINKVYYPRKQKRIRASACITASKLFLTA